MDAYKEVAARLAEGQKPSTNTQSAAIAQIAAEIELAVVEAHKEGAPNAVKCLERWARQLRAL